MNDAEAFESFKTCRKSGRGPAHVEEKTAHPSPLSSPSSRHASPPPGKGEPNAPSGSEQRGRCRLSNLAAAALASLPVDKLSLAARSGAAAAAGTGRRSGSMDESTGASDVSPSAAFERSRSESDAAAAFAEPPASSGSAAASVPSTLDRDPAPAAKTPSLSPPPLLLLTPQEPPVLCGPTPLEHPGGHSDERAAAGAAVISPTVAATPAAATAAAVKDSKATASEPNEHAEAVFFFTPATAAAPVGHSFAAAERQPPLLFVGSAPACRETPVGVTMAAGVVAAEVVTANAIVASAAAEDLGHTSSLSPPPRLSLSPPAQQPNNGASLRAEPPARTKAHSEGSDETDAPWSLLHENSSPFDPPPAAATVALSGTSEVGCQTAPLGPWTPLGPVKSGDLLYALFLMRGAARRLEHRRRSGASAASGGGGGGGGGDGGDDGKDEGGNRAGAGDGSAGGGGDSADGGNREDDKGGAAPGDGVGEGIHSVSANCMTGEQATGETAGTGRSGNVGSAAIDSESGSDGGGDGKAAEMALRALAASEALLLGSVADIDRLHAVCLPPLSDDQYADWHAIVATLPREEGAGKTTTGGKEKERQHGRRKEKEGSGDGAGAAAVDEAGNAVVEKSGNLLPEQDKCRPAIPRTAAAAVIPP